MYMYQICATKDLISIFVSPHILFVVTFTVFIFVSISISVSFSDNLCFQISFKLPSSILVVFDTYVYLTEKPLK